MAVCKIDKDTDQDLAKHFGEGDGPETLPAPASFKQAQKQERIWQYHRDVLLGSRIRFVSKDVTLQPPARQRRRVNRETTEQLLAAKARIAALFADR